MITYKTAEKHAKFITRNVPGAVIAGSYRRKSKLIGDIDVLVTSNLANVVQKLMDKEYIVAVLASGDERFSGIARIPKTDNYRRIDIVKTSIGEKPFALLYFTGDFVQNITMRQKATRKKFTLSQHGLKNTVSGRNVTGLKTERDIFKYLDITYVPPEERSHKKK
jgi:DNA polymerase/3'-5' exonuclease PolX